MLIDCLASTGSDAVALVLGGVLLLSVGMAVLLLARRRGRRSATAAALIALLLVGGLAGGLGGAAAPAHAAGACTADGPRVVITGATPTAAPTTEPTPAQTPSPTVEPESSPTVEPTATPTAEPTAAPTATPTSEPTALPTPEPTMQPTAGPTAPATPPATAPTSAPTTPLLKEFLSAAFTFEVTGMSDTAQLVTQRIWDDYNNCVVETRDPTDRRKWDADEFGEVTGTLRWEKIGSTTCAFDLSKLHYSFRFYESGSLMDEYLVNASFIGNPLPFDIPEIDKILGTATSACYGPYNSSPFPLDPHVSCTRRQETDGVLQFTWVGIRGPVSSPEPAPGTSTEMPAPSPTP